MRNKRIINVSLVMICFCMNIIRARTAYPDLKAIPKAAITPLKNLKDGSKEAQEYQKKAVKKLKLPLEVITRKTKIKFRLIPAGKFMMGSPESDKYRRPDERQHKVTLTKSFYLGVYEVTQGQWQQVMRNNPAWFKASGLKAPVEQVTWTACEDFCRKLCMLEGVPLGTYRLPTEAEWEYACRAGSKTSYCYGDSIEVTQANINDTYTADLRLRKNPVWQKKTFHVGSFLPNAFGLFDMHGNVNEWCFDWYGAYSNRNNTNPKGPKLGTEHVFRGGSWFNTIRACRSASRQKRPLHVKHRTVGLRLLRIIR